MTTDQLTLLAPVDMENLVDKLDEIESSLSGQLREIAELLETLVDLLKSR